MRSPLFLLARTLATATSVWAVDCDADPVGPLVVPVRDVELTNGHTMRGVESQAGTPPQNFSMLPSNILNNIWLYNTGTTFCHPNATDALCIGWRGGLYDVYDSETAENANSVRAAGADTSDVESTSGSNVADSGWVNDVLHVNDDVSLTGYPIGMPGEDINGPYVTQHDLGMGPNSTLLTALKDAGKIASRSYSWWWGINGATTNVQMDGATVLGGYDRAKTIGQGFTQSLGQPDKNCPSGMWLEISDLFLEFPNGTESSLTDSEHLSNACVLVNQPAILTLPRSPYWDTFEELTESEAVGRAASIGLIMGVVVYEAEDVFAGSFGFNINDSLRIVLPSNQAVVPVNETISSGAIESFGEDLRAIPFDPVSGSNIYSTPVIGRQFFQEAYPSVNFDLGTWTLWKANATEGEDLVAFKAEKGECAPANDATAADEADEGEEAGGQEAQQSEDSASMSTDAIAGTAFGSLAAVAIVAALACFFFRRRGRQRQKREKWPDVDDQPSNAKSAVAQHFGYGVVVPQVSELDSRCRPHEIGPGKPMPGHEIGPGKPAEWESSDSGLVGELPAGPVSSERLSGARGKFDVGGETREEEE